MGGVVSVGETSTACLLCTFRVASSIMTTVSRNSCLTSAAAGVKPQPYGGGSSPSANNKFN